MFITNKGSEILRAFRWFLYEELGGQLIMSFKGFLSSKPCFISALRAILKGWTPL